MKVVNGRRSDKEISVRCFLVKKCIVSGGCVLERRVDGSRRLRRSKKSNFKLVNLGKRVAAVFRL